MLIEFNVELLLLVINDYCYIIVKEIDMCKYVNIIKNKKILNMYNIGNYFFFCWNDFY